MQTRRNFLRNATLAAGSFAIAKSTWGQGSANGDIRCAVVGLNGRGKSLIRDVMRTDGARLVALCDVDTAVLDERAANVEEEHGIKVDKVRDYQKLLERKDIDAVVICTPNHWHALQTIWACQAGKDVYVEKPVCHSIWEGRRMMEAASKYNRIVQAGLQNRSDIGLGEAFPWIQAGNMGEITMVRGLCYKNRTGIGKRDTPLTPPSTVDYNTWLGPAKDEPMYREKFHYDWHWSWNTGNGDIGNQGPHEWDLIRWVLGDPDHPTKVHSFGGRFGWNDAGVTPNMQVASAQWNEIPVLFEVCDLWLKPTSNAAANYKGNRIGIVVTCEGGEFRGGRGGGIVYDNGGKKVQAFKGDGGFDHFPSFIRGVNSRKELDLGCTLETGFMSSCVPFMTNASYKAGEAVSDETVKEYAYNNGHVFEAYERFRKHLGDWNTDFSKEKWTLGSSLEFNGRRERYTGGDNYREANEFVKSDYRKEFEVPAEV